MLKKLRYTFSVIAMIFAVYGLVTNDFQFGPYMLLFLGLMMLVMGLEASQENQKASGWLLVVVFLLLSSSAVQTFILQ